ncbi:MAG: hypothetical protein J5789_06505 [Oscillospiraceae bacterium]|nr:hypothetical protein [Oscillospiraceae bacterium]
MYMIVEQTDAYPMRMCYRPETGDFVESGYVSLFHDRGFPYPYGWIEGSGTPPSPHWDCLLLSEGKYELGDRVAIKVVGVFRRGDGDHKYLAVEPTRRVSDYDELTDNEKDALHRLYPRVGKGEGWFGREMASWCMEHCEKSL